MKKFFILIIISLTLNYVARAQTNRLRKADSAKAQMPQKMPPKSDTLHVKYPLVILSNKFDRIDSANLNLTSDIPIKKYGFIDTADLKLTSCDFEKDAKAMVLFDQAVMACGIPDIIMERHKRIKIFNDNGKSEANIRIEFNNKFGAERILGVQAQTINLNDGKIEYTKLDPKLIYTEHTDANKDAVTFSMPNVKAGSVIEYRYVWERGFSRNVPDWDFQCNLPTRYSQLDAFLNPIIGFTALSRTDIPYTRDTISMSGLGHVWALSNIPSSKDEPFMRSAVDALQSLTLIISSVKLAGQTKNLSASWADVGKQIANDKDFIKPYDQSLRDEDDLVKKVKLLKTDDDKIAFLFKQVKTSMKWNEEKNWLSKEGIKSAWKKKTGNWGEINMVLCRLLKLSGIYAYPMLVSTRDNGRIFSNFINIYQINKLVIYVPGDGTKYYVLDATDKYSIYNEIPFDLLNSYGLPLNKEKDKYDLVFMKKEAPVKQVVLMIAEIKSDGTMSGTAQIGSFSYHKSNSLELYKLLDEKKYIEYLTDNDNNLRISSLKFENADVDSLPLLQNIDFKLYLPGTDEKYIFFNPNLFTGLYTNPFTDKNRVSDIDFGCSNIYSIDGRYKIPQGYKIEALPKNIIIVNYDKSISFKRVTAEMDGLIIVHYIITYNKSIFPRVDYSDVQAYYKRMTEILNEQIVLKKL